MIYYYYSLRTSWWYNKAGNTIYSASVWQAGKSCIALKGKSCIDLNIPFCKFNDPANVFDIVLIIEPVSIKEVLQVVLPRTTLSLFDFPTRRSIMGAAVLIWSAATPPKCTAESLKDNWPLDGLAGRTNCQWGWSTKGVGLGGMSGGPHPGENI